MGSWDIADLGLPFCTISMMNDRCIQPICRPLLKTRILRDPLPTYQRFKAKRYYTHTFDSAKPTPLVPKRGNTLALQLLVDGMK
jgi:hypothetical protein